MSVDPMEQKMIDALPEKTGRNLDEWLVHLRKVGLEKHGQVVSHLKSEHEVTHGYANLIAQYFGGRAKRLAGGDDDLLGRQYAGPKAHLFPIYEAIIRATKDFGPDVEVAPKKTYVSLRRKKQFGLVQPSTRARVDVGITLPQTAPVGRLEASGSFNAMVTHRVRVDDSAGIDAELIGWLRDAYVAAG